MWLHIKTTTFVGKICLAPCSLTWHVTLGRKQYYALMINRPSPAGGIPSRIDLHVCRWHKDDFGYGGAYLVCSGTAGCAVLFPSDKQDVHGRV